MWKDICAERPLLPILQPSRACQVDSVLRVIRDRTWVQCLFPTKEAWYTTVLAFSIWYHFISESEVLLCSVGHIILHYVNTPHFIESSASREHLDCPVFCRQVLRITKEITNASKIICLMMFKLKYKHMKDIQLLTFLRFGSPSSKHIYK